MNQPTPSSQPASQLEAAGQPVGQPGPQVQQQEGPQQCASSHRITSSRSSSVGPCCQPSENHASDTPGGAGSLRLRLPFRCPAAILPLPFATRDASQAEC